MPTANTTTPSHGAHHPSRLTGLSASTVADSSNRALAARMPKARSSNCTSPSTSRLAPDTICPAASSTVAMVRAAPGRNVTSGGMRMRTGLSMWTCCSVANTMTETANVTTTGNTSSSDASRGSFASPTSRPRTNAAPTAPDGRLEEEGEADRHHGVAERPDGPAERRRHPVDRVQPLERLVGCDRRARMPHARGCTARPPGRSAAERRAGCRSRSACRSRVPSRPSATSGARRSRRAPRRRRRRSPAGWSRWRRPSRRPPTWRPRAG